MIDGLIWELREPAVAERGQRCWRRNQPHPSGRGYCWVITTQVNDKKYVSRAGVKLEHALREFGVDVTGLVCADFGCNVGGFTDCLLKHGAAKVYAIDTGYGVLDYRLRTDDRVVVMERVNVLHAEFPREDPHPQPLSRGERGVRKDPLPKGIREGPDSKRGRFRSPSPPGRGVRGEGSSEHRTALDPKYLDFVRKLRQEQTDAEQLMWLMLRDRRLLDLKFRRQHPVEPYVVDFYCHELRLAIELDGGQHNEPKTRRKDKLRTQFLENQGIRVLRFWDHEVLKETEAVLEAVCFVVEKKREDPHPQPLSQRERGERKAALPGGEEVRGVDLVTIDVGWTRQQHAIPAARKWLPSGGRIITLVKPHYELEADEKKAWLVDGALSVDRAQQIFERVLEELPNLGVEVLASTTSPIRGAKSSRKKKNDGNVEYLVLARKVAAQ